jgi:hypothetical protein
MTKKELQKLHEGGVTYSGALANGTPFSQRNKPDGSVEGKAGDRFTLSGTWRIDDSGRYCHDVKASGGLAFSTCSIIWKAGNKYYNSTNDTRVNDRQFVK